MMKKPLLLGILFLMFISVNVFGLTSDTENILNGDFADETTNWLGGFYTPGTGSISESNEELLISITDGGTATWNVQVNQGNINLISGAKYTFSFDARSIAARTIEANVGMSADPYTSYFASGPINLSTDMTNYSFTFTATANDSTARVEFNCGLDTNDVYIDNVSLIGGAAPTPIASPTPEIINFPDQNLEAAVKSELNLGDGPIYNTDVYTITSENLSMKNITDITGLEYFSGLTKLMLGNNYIKNLTPLENLTYLEDLNIGANHLSVLTPLENLTNLKKLNLVVNDINDITPLENLTNLTNILLEYNNLIDITPLANLTKVTYLKLNDNEINDITPLENLTNTTYLDLSKNNINDITPLENLTNMSELNLCENPISDITALGNLKNMKKLVLNVDILENIEPLENCTNLVSLNLNHNSISDITPLANLTNLKVLFIVGNPLNEKAQPVIDKLLANGTRVLWSSIETPIVTPTITPSATPVVTPTVTSSVTPVVTPTTSSVITPIESTDYTIDYVIQNSWSNGATINLTITNNTSTTINGWTLNFSFPGDQKITNLWGGTYTQNTANVTIMDEGWNANISSKETKSIGFQITSSNPTETPTNFTLN